MPRDARQTACAVPAFVLLVALAACGFDAEYSGTHLRCPADSPRCPAGFTCVDGVCVTGGGPDAPAGPDASTCELAAAAADNDGCGAAIDLTAAALAAGGATAYGDTTGYADDRTPPTLPGCTGQPQPGPDALYFLTLAAGDDGHATLFTEGWTGALYLLDACTPTATCAGGVAGFSELTATDLPAGTHYLVVDAPTTGSAGCFRLVVSVTR